MVHVTLDYYICVEDRQYIVKRDTGNADKDGHRIYKNLSYCTTFFQALEACKKYVFARKLSQKDIGLSEAIAALKEINEDFCEKFYNAAGEEPGSIK